MSESKVLLIGPSNNWGINGNEVDQKVLASYGCHALTATTSLSSFRKSRGITVSPTTPEFLREQIDSIIEDVGVQAVKTELFESEKTILVVVDALKKHNITLSVVTLDLDISSANEERLPKSNNTLTLSNQLLPLTYVLVLSIPEAIYLLNGAGRPTEKPRSTENVLHIAKELQKSGPKYILVIGSSFQPTDAQNAVSIGDGNEVTASVLYGGDHGIIIKSISVNQSNALWAKGPLTTAIAANLAKGLEVVSAVKAAFKYVEAGVKTKTEIGNGIRIFNSFHSTYTLPFAPGNFVEYLLDHPNVQGPWKQHTEHEFLTRLGDGTLPLEAFKYYLIQDYLFLIQFARANSLAGYKEKDLEKIARSAEIVLHIRREMTLHLSYCKDFGLSKDDILAVAESQSCTAYTRYVLDIGQSEDWLALQVALSPCLIGYGVIARRLYDDPRTLRDGNPYWKWIQNYVADDYTEAVTLGKDLLEKYAQLQSSFRIEELVKIFIHATNMETGFWDLGYGQTEVFRKFLRAI